MAQNAATSPARNDLAGLTSRQLDMIEATRARSERRADRRELVTELFAAAAFLAAALALWLGASAPAPGWLGAWICLLFAVLARVEFEVGEGTARPVVLAVVPGLLLLPAPVVPLVVAAGQVAARLPDVVGRRAPARQLPMMVADSWFAIFPALVVAATGVPDGFAATALVVGAAIAAQIVGDFAVSATRIWAAVGLRPRDDLDAYAWVYAVDLLLAPAGLLAAVAARESALALAALVPLAALIAIFARERRARVDNALALQRLSEESRERLQSILQHSSDLVLIVDPDGALRGATGTAAPIFGERWHSDALGSLLDRVHPGDHAAAAELLAAAAALPPGESAEGEWRMRYADGSHRHMAAVATNLLDDRRVAGLAVTARDVEARKAFEEQLRHRAFHDELTGLANRALFFDRVEHALMRARREEVQMAVLFIDIDDFKPVNDRLGHAAGDRALQEVAARLDAGARSIDTVARLGGDEFGVLLEEVASARAVRASQRLLEQLEEAVEIDGEPVALTASVGMAVSGNGAEDADELLRKADIAMYHAKRTGKGRLELYRPEMLAPVSPGRAQPTWFGGRQDEQRAEVQSLLDDPGALTMAFQPIMDLRAGRVAGYEALSRFNRAPSRPPDQWFAAAHRCGLGYKVEAKALAAALAAPGRPAGAYLAVNLSPSSLTAAEVQAVLPARLDEVVIELTENELASGDPAITAALADLRARGARIAVDDAGAGYAGLTHVMRLAPHIIKLDRALIAGIDQDPIKASLVRSFVQYARDVGATVCAEGVETAAELGRLADLDVGYAQGYFISRPAAPWAALEGTAGVASAAVFEASIAEADAEGGDDPDRLLERLARALSQARTADALQACMRPAAEVLGADEARIVPGGAGVAAHTRIGDPDADPEEIAALQQAGYRSKLALPIGATGARLEAYSRADRPWTRFHISRARIISHQLEPLLERLRLPSR